MRPHLAASNAGARGAQYVCILCQLCARVHSHRIIAERNNYHPTSIRDTRKEQVSKERHRFSSLWLGRRKTQTPTISELHEPIACTVSRTGDGKDLQPPLLDSTGAINAYSDWDTNQVRRKGFCFTTGAEGWLSPTSSFKGNVLQPQGYTHSLRWRNSTALTSLGNGKRFDRVDCFHTSAIQRQESSAHANTADDVDYLPQRSPSALKLDTAPQNSSVKPAESQIRKQLRSWQERHGAQWDVEHSHELRPPMPVDIAPDGQFNFLSRTGEEGSERELEYDAEKEAAEVRDMLSQSSHGDINVAGPISDRMLKPGMLVELRGFNADGNNTIAIYVRHILNGAIGQFFTIHGRWRHCRDTRVLFAHASFVSTDELEKITPYLPNPKDGQELEELAERMSVDELHIPRHISRSLINRMTHFHGQSLELYRKNASALDNAHFILAHDTDLRYGTLHGVASTLLKMPTDELSPVALYTVQRSLLNAGFAFGFDVRFFRATGHLQIRSQSQVQMVHHVRDWVRHWQDDLAVTAAMTSAQIRKHQPATGAETLYNFIDKARNIVMQSRQTRDVTHCGTIGPSKIKRELLPHSESVKLTTTLVFTRKEQEVLRFLEAWACADSFGGHASLSALPPLILQATGLYKDHDFSIRTGYLFLQEVGTILPYENRIKFDPYLLLPSSQQSKPLQTLMGSLVSMRGNHDLQDSMADLRHDWADLPVFCIDSASAHEIDDGISVEPGTNGDCWVHIHIANPTAFFHSDHPLARMARHMGESIYMPERTYMMMPRWSTDELFSLERDRPCLTFSAKFDPAGVVSERRIRNGIVRNVIRLTPSELDRVFVEGSGDIVVKLGHENILSVGGQIPPEKPRESALPSLSIDQVTQLRLLRDLSIKRFNSRKAAGGVFLDSQKPEVNVWQRWGQDGLKWEPPYRAGSRTVEGDPVIRMHTHAQDNWFKPSVGPANMLVREMMLLACEVAGSWCSERQIPMLYRGTIPSNTQDDPDVFLHETLMPAAEKNDGIYPLNLGLEYMRKIGVNVLSSAPLKHKVLGMDFYGKVTSPLRRYGDMIVHWQIEAALREEARIGKSLTTVDNGVERAFLPFNIANLKNIMTALGTRERLIMLTKARSEEFWASMLLFRAFHYRETSLPFTIFHATVFSAPAHTVTHRTLGVLCQELGMNMAMQRPDSLDASLGLAKPGDVWECCIENVDVFARTTTLKPIRLVKRLEF
ncbi:RNB-domain-containing protein [Polychaeton citri CBS 116435]|uniref:RNB-domain-containing protein n=1 Tax=Polychaeton citri CBS 116435 TaxID=1314669 RepID=A0A9P4Q7E9_9PEZI|nr:RNB-domain-containing protein [Polychaeton citri CBS 116435]